MKILHSLFLIPHSSFLIYSESEMNDNVTICTQDLVKRFRTLRGMVTAVNGVTLQVRRGETYGLIGPDGAGKTTTTRVILGLLKRTAGESSVLGYDSMRNTYEIRERVGYIAQQTPTRSASAWATSPNSSPSPPT
jgi:ABC-2 type transport system ATP-binding protein